MLTELYPFDGQMRLDEDEDDRADHGRCIDSWRVGKGQHFYVREHAGKSVDLYLTPHEILALRDGLNRILVAHGVEQRVTIQVAAESLDSKSSGV